MDSNARANSDGHIHGGANWRASRPPLFPTRDVPCHRHRTSAHYLHAHALSLLLSPHHQVLTSPTRLSHPSPSRAQYHNPERETSVAACIHKFCAKLYHVVPPEALQDSNAFRKSKCYTPLTDAALVKHKASLRAMYNIYSRGNKDLNDNLQSDKLMSFGEWLTFLEHTGLLETNQVSLFGAKCIFKWSRIRSLKDYSDKSEMRLRNLFFEDFLCVALAPTAPSAPSFLPCPGSGFAPIHLPISHPPTLVRPHLPPSYLRLTFTTVMVPSVC